MFRNVEARPGEGPYFPAELYPAGDPGMDGALKLSEVGDVETLDDTAHLHMTTHDDPTKVREDLSFAAGETIPLRKIGDDWKIDVAAWWHLDAKTVQEYADAKARGERPPVGMLDPGTLKIIEEVTPRIERGEPKTVAELQRVMVEIGSQMQSQKPKDPPPEGAGGDGLRQHSADRRV